MTSNGERLLKKNAEITGKWGKHEKASNELRKFEAANPEFDKRYNEEVYLGKDTQEKEQGMLKKYSKDAASTIAQNKSKKVTEQTKKR